MGSYEPAFNNYSLSPQGENIRDTSECVFLGAFTSAQGSHRKIALKKTIKWAYFERIAQKGQRKMIIYLNAWTVILHEVNNP